MAAIGKLQALSPSKHMPGKMCNCDPATPRTRLERLLMERKLRKSNRLIDANEDSEDSSRDAELFADDSVLTEAENWVPPNQEGPLERVDGCERQDGQPPKQRLLVVANRLPVSAVRRGEDSWQLEISVGGLVSALLGK